MAKNTPASAGDIRGCRFDSSVGRFPEEGMATHSIFLPGESHGQRSLAAYLVHGVEKTQEMTEMT